MQKTLHKIFSFILFTALLFTACRSESDLFENNANKENAVRKFSIFQNKNNANLFSKKGEDFDYRSTFG